MAAASDISDHYSQGGLLARLEASLREDGVEPAQATVEELALTTTISTDAAWKPPRTWRTGSRFPRRTVSWISAAASAARRATWRGASAAGSAE